MAAVIPFLGHKNIFSNFYKCPIVSEGKTYSTSESYYQSHKANQFKNFELAERISKATTGLGAKKLSWQIEGFDSESWYTNKAQIMAKGLLLKFLQNPECEKALLDTKDALLVEASASDVYWGIGVSLKDFKTSREWKGENMMGRLLMTIRVFMSDDFDRVNAIALTAPPMVETEVVTFNELAQKIAVKATRPVTITKQMVPFTQVTTIPPSQKTVTTIPPNSVSVTPKISKHNPGGDVVSKRCEPREFVNSQLKSRCLMAHLPNNTDLRKRKWSSLQRYGIEHESKIGNSDKKFRNNFNKKEIPDVMGYVVQKHQETSKAICALNQFPYTTHIRLNATAKKLEWGDKVWIDPEQIVEVEYKLPQHAIHDGCIVNAFSRTLSVKGHQPSKLHEVVGIVFKRSRPRHSLGKPVIEYIEAPTPVRVAAEPVRQFKYETIKPGDLVTARVFDMPQGARAASSYWLPDFFGTTQNNRLFFFKKQNSFIDCRKISKPISPIFRQNTHT